MFTPDIKSLLEGIPNPSMILDDNLRIIDMNSLMETITGYSASKVRGVHGELVLRSNVGNNRDRCFRKVLKTGEAISVTGDILNSYRRKIQVNCHISSLVGGGSGDSGLLVVIEILPFEEDKQGAELKSFAAQGIIGHSAKMQKVFEKLQLIAQTDASALITGETGTGKDKIAEAIHNHSSRAKFPFIKINCGALPHDLLESELFGYEKGAFTGATRNKAGIFKLADKGTLFLTEIGDIPLSLQVKLLSVLDDSRFFPVGSEKSVEVDVRIIAATHRPLRELMKRNEFRADLFYRLNVLFVKLPPLRERNVDIRYLLDHFLEKFTSSLEKKLAGFSPEAMEELLAYSYPGNVREMSNIVEYAVNMCREKSVGKEHLPSYIFSSAHEALRTDKVHEPQPLPPPPPPLSSESWNDIERQMIVDTLKQNDGIRKKAAAQLHWSRMKLWRKMKKYKLLK